MASPSALPILWSATARQNLAEIRTYIDTFAPLAAQRLAARLVATAESLAAHPERGRSIGHGLRELVAVSPYVIRYRVTTDAVRILRIRHGTQRPD